MKHQSTAVSVGAAILLATGFLLAAEPLFAADATFERNFSTNGRPDLSIATGSGSIHLSAGAPGQVHIVGHIHSSWGADEGQVRNLADHPPLEQTGNIVRVGVHAGNLHNISIDYEIQAPTDAFLEAASGSGAIVDDGVGANARLNTGSGNIHAKGLSGDATIGTGSGNIEADFTGSGNIKAETGSGSVELSNVHGGLRAHTGSGHVKVNGTPAGPWQIETGSGSVELWTGGSAFTLDASCGAGGVESDRSIAVQGKQSKRHLAGNVNGGGPEVRVETGAGSIHIH
jgi:hypothetical protein